MADYNSIEEIFAAGIDNMEVLINNISYDDNVFTASGADWLKFNNVTVANVYVSGNTFFGFGTNSEHLKVNRRDTKMWYLYRDLTSEEGTWEIAAQLYRFGYTYYYLIANSQSDSMRRFNYAVIQDGYLYCFNYGLTGVYKISLTNPTDVKFMEHPSGAVVLPPTDKIYSSFTYGDRYCNISTAFNVMYDTVYFSNGYIENGKIVETAYNFSATGNPKDNNYPYGLCSTGKPGLRVGPFLFSFGGDYGSGNYPQKLSSMNILGNYLATINNLNKPVQKTADKTMKITYILREEE